jgi:hypothetical protein
MDPLPYKCGTQELTHVKTPYVTTSLKCSEVCCEHKEPHCRSLAVHLADVLRGVPVDPSSQMELAVPLARAERSVLPRHSHWISAGSLHCHLPSLVAPRYVGRGRSVGTMELRSFP